MGRRKIDPEESSEFREAVAQPKKRRGESKSVSTDDKDLFRQMVGDVRPVAQVRENTRHDGPRPSAAHRQADEARVLEELLTHEIDPAMVETGEELFFLRSGIQHRVLRQLRRGRYSVEASLDLHDMNAQAAETSIRNFLADCQKDGRRCVKIIHGKGLRSKSRGPVLKNLTNSLLRRHKAVLAFASAPYHDGGTGAVRVLLRKRQA